MLKLENITYLIGILSVTLFAIVTINYTSKLIFRNDQVKGSKKPINQIYDVSRGLNATQICLLSTDIYKTGYEDSECQNKTLIHWYIPWMSNELWNAFKRRTKEIKREKEMQRLLVDNNTETENAKGKVLQGDSKSHGEKVKKRPSEVIYTILVGLLVLSALGACWEVFKNKIKGRNADSGGSKAQDRDCSLADFTINRHLRRESKQHGNLHLMRQASFDVPAKVTQNLIHQSSLDRTSPKMVSQVIENDLRRNSVPSSPTYDIAPPRHSISGSSNPPLRVLRQNSLDMTCEEGNLDARKKPRHIIRRH
ncbi:hypothetical protein RUM43_013970 [Polyplax serrata]|uniref:Uncharacterized protein n=1 Tax=Polyplax serrata TaxID=468196 RepID=A0AAN8PSX2_POLSC